MGGAQRLRRRSLRRVDTRGTRMQETIRDMKARMSEEACLEELMALRYGGRELLCRACGHRHRFLPAVKRRACSCEGCGHDLCPALGTPFEKLRTPLTDWFLAVRLLRQGRPVARELVRQAGLPAAAAERMEKELRAFERQAGSGTAFEGWLDKIAAFADHGHGAPEKPRSTTPPMASEPAREPPAPKPKAPQKPATAIRRRQWPLLTAGLLAGIAVGAGLVLALHRNTEPGRPEQEVGAATLSFIPPKPSLRLAAVEEDIVAAKQAVEAITKTRESVSAPVPTPMPAPRPPDPKIASTGNPNEILTFGPIKVQRHIAETIVRASQVVGADPTLLMAIADKESSFATEVKAKTSSATGLYQFIERTWFGVVKQFGEKHGLAREAQAIVRNGKNLTVPDPVERARILDLRRDPYLSALLAGEMLRSDTLQMEKKLGRHLTGGEIYLLHFLGPGDAEDFIESVAGNPNADASALLPKPAGANPSIFRDSEGSKTVAEVHKMFEEMIGKRLDRYQTARQLGGGLVVPAKAGR